MAKKDEEYDSFDVVMGIIFYLVAFVILIIFGMYLWHVVSSWLFG